MAGIYIHVPFCKQACYYCNFHFSTSLDLKQDMILAMHKELDLRSKYLNPNIELNSIYFGGGTPSLFTVSELQSFIDHISKSYKVNPMAEITIEANPDDLTYLYLKELRSSSINRLSIGVQSFFEPDLQYMNRAHSASQSEASLKEAQDIGYTNISIDLIYGTPTMTDQLWRDNLDKAIELNIGHLSCYGLTVEDKTALSHRIAKGITPPVLDDSIADQFTQLIDTLVPAGYDHYEISNLAKPGHYAVHNTNYWKAKPYLGIGPSAHSFNGNSRQWNIANNPKYIKSLLNNEILDFHKEELSEKDHYNEYILTSMRTMWGVDINVINTKYKSDFLTAVVPLIKDGLINHSNGNYTLSSQGKLLSDFIARALFI